MPKPPTTPKQRRLWRLVGGPGKSDTENGGGVEVASLFSTILERALDEDVVEFAPLVADIRQRYEYKTSRLRQVYGLHDLLARGGDPFPAFTRDGLDQLVATKFLTAGEDDTWRPDPDHLVPGALLAVVPESGRRRVRVRVLSRDAREAHDSAAVWRMNAVSEAAELKEGRPGLRELDEAHVERLMASMEMEGGWLPHHPRLVDTEGRWIIDGRHRMEAARRLGYEEEQWPTLEVKVDSPEQALALAVHANEALGWTTEDYARLDELFAGAGLKTQQRDNKRAWLRFEIEQNEAAAKKRSLREIAREVGVTHPVALTVRSELQRATGGKNSYHQSQIVVGSDGVEQVIQSRRPDPEITSPRDLAAELNVRDALGSADARPASPTPSPEPELAAPLLHENLFRPEPEPEPAAAPSDPVVRADAVRTFQRYAGRPTEFAAYITHLVALAEQAGIPLEQMA